MIRMPITNTIKYAEIVNEIRHAYNNVELDSLLTFKSYPLPDHNSVKETVDPFLILSLTGFWVSKEMWISGGEYIETVTEKDLPAILSKIYQIPDKQCDFIKLLTGSRREDKHHPGGPSGNCILVERAPDYARNSIFICNQEQPASWYMVHLHMFNLLTGENRPLEADLPF